MTKTSGYITLKPRRTFTRWSVVVMALGLTMCFAFAGNVAADEDASQSPGKIEFVGKNMLVTANGSFHDWHFTKVRLGSDDMPVKEVTLEVDVASLDTASKKRDEHLRTADFFDTEKYPTATLRVYDIQRAEGDAYLAKLDFDMHGVQKTYEDFAFDVTNTGPVQVEGEFEFSRMDFEIGEPHKKLSPMSIKEKIQINFSAMLPESDLVPETE